VTRPKASTDLEWKRQVARDVGIQQRRGRGARDRGDTGARDTFFPPPATLADRVILANKQVRWLNTDTGWTESYYTVTGEAGLTVPGLVAGTTPGWYPVGAGPVMHLVPSAQQTLTTGVTFTNWAAPGTGKSWRRGGTSWFTLAAGVVTFPVAGRYRLTMIATAQQGAGTGRLFVIKNNSAVDPNVLSQMVFVLDGTYDTERTALSPSEQFAANDNVRLYAANVGSAIFMQGADGQRERMGFWTIEYVSPALVGV